MQHRAGHCRRVHDNDGNRRRQPADRQGACVGSPVPLLVHLEDICCLLAHLKGFLIAGLCIESVHGQHASAHGRHGSAAPMGVGGSRYRGNAEGLCVQSAVVSTWHTATHRGLSSSTVLHTQATQPTRQCDADSSDGFRRICSSRIGVRGCCAGWSAAAEPSNHRGSEVLPCLQRLLA